MTDIAFMLSKIYSLTSLNEVDSNEEYHCEALSVLWNVKEVCNKFALIIKIYNNNEWKIIIPSTFPSTIEVDCNCRQDVLLQEYLEFDKSTWRIYYDRTHQLIAPHSSKNSNRTSSIQKTKCYEDFHFHISPE